MARPRSMYQLGEDSPLRPKGANVGIMAFPGVGKTTLWGSGGDKEFSKRVAIMNSDNSGSIVSAERSGSNAHIIEVFDYDQLAEAYEWVKHEAIPANALDWFVWDSATLFQDRVLIDDILVDAHLENPRQSEDVASQREYLINMNRIGKYMRLFVELPINFGVSFHVMSGTDPDGEVVYMPMMQGKKGEFASYICGYLNVVAYLGVTQSGTRRLITDRSYAKDYFVKDQFHALRTNGKGYLDNPSLPKIDSLIKAVTSGASSGAPVRRRRRRVAATS